MALRSKLNGLRAKVIVREPAAWRFGERFGESFGESLSVALIEPFGMGNQGIEIKGRELFGRKR
jgi:hypothetical protein